MVEINKMSNSDDYDNGDSGNNNRGIVVGVNHFFFLFCWSPCKSFLSLTKVLSKFVLRYSFATIRFFKWKLNNEREKLNLRNEEKNATIQYYGWRLPKVEDDLQDARRSNEDKDGQLVTDQKKLQIQT
jgi:hypothetical protein